jgi:hypothetical protein
VTMTPLPPCTMPGSRHRTVLNKARTLTSKVRRTSAGVKVSRSLPNTMPVGDVCIHARTHTCNATPDGQAAINHHAYSIHPLHVRWAGEAMPTGVKPSPAQTHLRC